MKFNFPLPKIKAADIIRIDTLIGKKAIIDGEVTGKGNFKIDGTINGDVVIRGDLVTGEKSRINGNVIARNIVIAGVVTGDIEASGQLTIKSGGVTSGKQKCGSLIVEEGSNVKGNCDISGIMPDEINETDEI